MLCCWHPHKSGLPCRTPEPVPPGCFADGDRPSLLQHIGFLAEAWNLPKVQLLRRCVPVLLQSAKTLLVFYSSLPKARYVKRDRRQPQELSLDQNVIPQYVNVFRHRSIYLRRTHIPEWNNRYKSAPLVPKERWLALALYSLKILWCIFATLMILIYIGEKAMDWQAGLCAQFVHWQA